ncbi:MAG: PD40 domain-containing protein [Bacteroidetes bacterium]|nr:PD40 domain-containing protein [Bacteroidota bacterium]
MQKIVILFFSIFIFNVSLNGQGKADYRQKFTEGNYLILEGNYALALQNFIEAYKIDSSNSNINFKVGLCYLRSETEKSKALYYLEKAVTNTSKNYNDLEPTEKSAPVNAYYYYGQALHFTYKFDEALANYEKFKSYLKDKNVVLIKDVDRQIEISNNAKSLTIAPMNIILKNLGDSINTSAPEYSPVLSADEKTIMFTSRRSTGTGMDKTDDGQFYEDIYIAYKKSDSTWTTPVSVSSNVNSISHEATVGLTADAQTLLIYKDSNGGDIYYSTLDGNSWTFPQAMGSDINSPKWETSACLSPDGNTLYYVSDREGGLGGRDIWKCVKLPNGKWSMSVNLGAPINTPYDEESPFIHPSGNVLFFSSTGHQTIGGFDIFFSAKNEETNTWEMPLNIGYPINTTDDDVFYVTSPDGKRGYYSSSSRPEGYGEKDIYMVSLPERKEVPLVLIKGYIIPAEGQPLPPNLEISATNNETGVVAGVYKPMMRDGSFTIIIPPGSNYTLSYTNDGQEFFSEIIEVPMSAAYQEINKEVRLKGVSLGGPIASTNPKDSTATNTTNPTTNDANDDVAFINISGQMLDDKNVGIPNFKVNLLNSKGEIVQTTTTDALGFYVFTNLPAHEDYLVALDVADIVVSKKSSIEIKDQDGNPVKTKKEGHKYKHGKNIVTIKTGKYKKTDVRPVNAPHEQLASTDKLNFEMYFRYNVTETDVNDTPFKEYINNLEALYKKNGKINLSIVSSASQVPTKAYPTNKALSIARNDKMREQIITALKERGITEENIIITKFKAYVDGPQYQRDFLTNRALYEKYQFVRVSAN